MVMEHVFLSITIKMNVPKFLIPAILVLLISCLPAILAQQPYVRKAGTECGVRDNSTTVLGYSCNGLRRRCQAYVTFRANPPYASVADIATLLSVNSTELSQLNGVRANHVFQTNQIVLVPVTCSCSGDHYQANVSYVVRPEETFWIIANNTFQGLSTCQAIEVQNNIPAVDLPAGARITVPLRCACPTRNQTAAGVNYLLSYLLTWNQFVYSVSVQFGVDTDSTLAANKLSETDSTVYPFTTLLIPLQNPPTATQSAASPPPPPPSGSLSPPPAPSPGGSSSKTWVYAVVGAVGGILLTSAAGGLIFCLFFRRRRRTPPKPDPTSSESFESVEKPLTVAAGEDSVDFMESLSSIAQSLKIYPYKELRSATQDFNPSCWIKGSVYRGTINGDHAAIKKVNGDVSKEIALLNKINHFNLIRLSGVSFNDGDWYLVYEYASNGPLSDWIHQNSEDRIILNWDQRLQIALDIAAGLNYLHRYTSPPHVHKDLNSTNVLLDHNLRAKIVNFRLARSADGQDSQFALTRHIVGTKGYMAPEYLANGVVSTKLDVYSFGILLMEILTGKDVSYFSDEANATQFSDILSQVMQESNWQENLKNLMDSSLEGKYPPDIARIMFKLIDSCRKKDPSDRPTMDDIFQALSRLQTSTPTGDWTVSINEQRTAPR
ncbi:lysM domain receptor-like kinase 4 [Andrographis paniculata]|uniref:lysM domain receptor-like kinase 4 n=1 Tax=Andrographis paniculata TaxID=175694 RepID=UPI0021E973D9|nr:lysM domain receptor-like kinase 4 [Andrographis paniculata]